ncbi:adhesion G protein-coupled receptor E1-like isoform X2 [Choloepus didactylus]|uniref:adhesion G protein-coupled receptor E1-like isoform X2 n=1 Tax=Choloepus didactylus TaxID=27675 RepID=UPI00189CA036|nr:adhesion G protein-coupled receptor E1-like isoform X2 [Choloepus didactylus]
MHFRMWGFSLILFWGCCGVLTEPTWESTTGGCCDGLTEPTWESTTGDVNECVDTSVCPAYATCTNTFGSYYCTCKQGFLSSNRQRNFRGPGVECEDVDECSQSPPPCGPNSSCTNLKGRYKCSCLPGFSSPAGDGWIPGKPGHFACSDVDECANPRACPEHASCHNTVGSYSCSCNPGFASISGNLSFQGSGGRCEDVDECANPRACPEHAGCHNTVGSYSCSCNPGFASISGNLSFQGSGGRCEDVDECANPRACPEHAGCHNTVGSYSCSCNPGFASISGNLSFQGSGGRCEDVDECSQSPPPCGPNSNCTNLMGRYKCSCLPGFSSPTGNGWISGKPGRFACSDVDECANPRACPEHASCHNSVGSYSCSCNPGFTSISENLSFQSSGGRCEDVDECSQSPPPCGPNTNCTNLMGRYKCSCLPGFSSPTGNGWNSGKPGSFACSDVDECANPRACPEHAGCHNSVGSYSCSCNPGFASISGNLSFQGSGGSCEDVDECSQSPPPCGPNSNCTNLMGRYKCSCLPGFSSPTGNGWISGKPGSFACSDVDECANPRACPEHASCHNSVGSYSCSCNPGFASSSGELIFQGPGGRCEGVNECADTTVCPAYATCTDTFESYYCTCKQGFLSSNRQRNFRGSGVECKDIDECSQSPPPCGPNSNCTNLMGRYKCSCLPGFSSPTGNDWISGKPGHFACSDVDECVNHRACPEHASCHNSLGSYSCSCNPGFASSSGSLNFQGPGGRCKDVDECSQNSILCGPNSVCINIPGEYNCSCLPGFFSPYPWIPEKPEAFQCKDIDECAQDPSPCGPNSICTNALGSYSCNCAMGFRPNPEGSWKDDNFSCIDRDECSQNPPHCGPNSNCTNLMGRYKCSCLPGFSSPTGNDWILGNPGHFACSDVDECANPRPCPEHASCHNSPGSYSCSCNPGFASSSKNLSFQGPGGRCEDIDECSQDPSPCGPSSTCANALGSYSCDCIMGFRPNSEGSWKDGNFSCIRIPFKCKEDMIPNNEHVQLCQGKAAMAPEYVYFCALMNTTFSILDDACKKKTGSISLKKTVEIFGTVLAQIPTWSKFTKEETSTLATVLLESVESTTLAAFLNPSANASQTIQTEFLDIESKVIKEECIEENMSFNLKAKGDMMTIGCSTVEESGSSGTTGVAFVSLEGMESVLDESFFQDPQAPLTKCKRQLKMNSRIVRGILTGVKKDNFSDPVIYTLENIQPKQKFESPICVSWYTDVEGRRRTSSGCVILKASKTHTVCSCKHLANVVIIMASSELTMEYTLYLISHVGLIISLVCLALAIITFLLCRHLRNCNTDLHLHLCVCLFLGKILLFIGVDKTNDQLGCAIIAGFLHYLFLACFFWMLVEAAVLFLMARGLKVVNYFNSHIKMVQLCAFGYGLPALVVVVSASVHPQGFGMHNHCWLDMETVFIWSFLGPVTTIILVNCILLIWTLRILRKKLSSVNAEVSMLKDTRLLIFKALVLLFILGCPWVLDIFQIGATASIMTHLSTIISSLQGAFIFLIHCLLNHQVREEYRRWFTRKTKASSQSQTSGVLLSSLPSTSKMDIEVPP